MTARGRPGGCIWARVAVDRLLAYAFVSARRDEFRESVHACVRVFACVRMFACVSV